MLRKLALVLILAPAILLGHTDINEIIKDLTAKIKATPTPDLYYQRATEYRALREKDHTIEDLRAALKLDHNHRPSRIALIGELGESDEAMTLAIALYDSSQDIAQKLEGAYLVANAHRLRGNLQKALEICETLQELDENHSTEIDLLHTDLLLSLHRPADAAAIFKNSWKRTNSIVLRNNWIDTSLTAKQPAEVLPLIEKEISSSRFRSSWLIRRARARLIAENKEQAHQDLRDALTEIEVRLRPDQPDLTLIADRGLIHALLGNEEKAKADLKALQSSILSPSAYRILSEQLR